MGLPYPSGINPPPAAYYYFTGRAQAHTVDPTGLNTKRLKTAAQYRTWRAT
jgi:hypothetical protein